MESFALLLVMLSMLGGIFFIVALIIRKIRKKPKNKMYHHTVCIRSNFKSGIQLKTKTGDSWCNSERENIEKNVYLLGGKTAEVS